MTHPIPGADSERELFEQAYGPKDSFAWRNESGTYKVASLQLAWELWQKARADRAAAKVGANVAADVRALADKWNREAIAAGFAASEDAYALYEILGDFRPAGAPAETPKTIDHDAFWVLVAHCRDAAHGADYIGKRNKLVEYVNTWAAARPTPTPAETPKPDTCAEMRALCEYCGGTGDVHSIDGEWRGRCTCAAAQPAPIADSDLVKRLQGQVNDLHKLLEIRKSSDERIERLAPIAGDVEKDAARYRLLRQKSQMHYTCFRDFTPGWGGSFKQRDGKELDRDIDAAMLAPTSSGEAG